MQSFYHLFPKASTSKPLVCFYKLGFFFFFSLSLYHLLKRLGFFIPLVFTSKTTQPLVFFEYLVIAIGWYLASNVLRSKIICYHSLTTHLYLVSKSALQSHVKTFQTLPTYPTIFLWFTEHQFDYITICYFRNFTIFKIS